MQIASPYFQAFEFFGGFFLILFALFVLLIGIEVTTAKSVTRGKICEKRQDSMETNIIYGIYLNHRKRIEIVYITCANLAPIFLSVWVLIVFGFPHGIGTYFGVHFLFGYLFGYNPFSLEKTVDNIYHRMLWSLLSLMSLVEISDSSCCCNYAWSDYIDDCSNTGRNISGCW